MIKRIGFKDQKKINFKYLPKKLMFFEPKKNLNFNEQTLTFNIYQCKEDIVSMVFGQAVRLSPIGICTYLIKQNYCMLKRVHYLPGSTAIIDLCEFLLLRHVREEHHPKEEKSV